VAVLIDTLNDRRSGVAFRVNPRGVQTDSVVSDTAEEDFSPDYFYEAVARRVPGGWAAEMRIPLSSLRYPAADPQTWGVILMRNYPRDFRYIMANTPIPKSSNCFLCHAATVTGLEGLPTGGHFTLAPYVAGNIQRAEARRSTTESDLGLDLKWKPSTRLTVDATLNPDFSQIEADVPQLDVNNRFALSYPEKRTFFLEGVDLLSTPMRAVYTRTIQEPAWGLRATGESGANAYTLLVAQDRSGPATVAIGRLRRSVGSSYAGVLATTREAQGGGHNRLLGPDFLWKPTPEDRLAGQLLVTDTDGRRGFGSRLYFTHDAQKWDMYAGTRWLSPEFRADNGFMPYVNVQETYVEGAGRFYPKRGFTYVRPYFGIAYAREYDGHELMWQQLHPGVYFQGKWGSDGWITYRAADRERVNGNVLEPAFLEFSVRAAPKRWLPALKLEGSFGEKIDYLQGRLGEGAKLALSATTRPTDHLELEATVSREWLDLPAGRLFDAQIDWVKATYTFSSRSLVRLTGQQSTVNRAGEDRDRNLSLSGLYGYKLNWQTVFFIGYGDSSITDERGVLTREARTVFMKVAYAFQR
jgi:hypothetical protein